MINSLFLAVGFLRAHRIHVFRCHLVLSQRMPFIYHWCVLAFWSQAGTPNYVAPEVAWSGVLLCQRPIDASGRCLVLVKMPSSACSERLQRFCSVQSEVLSGRYDEKVDAGLSGLGGAVGLPVKWFGAACGSSTETWSIGVITYLLLSGKHPFTGKTVEQVEELGLLERLLSCFKSHIVSSYQRVSHI